MLSHPQPICGPCSSPGVESAGVVTAVKGVTTPPVPVPPSDRWNPIESLSKCALVPSPRNPKLEGRLLLSSHSSAPSVDPASVGGGSVPTRYWRMSLRVIIPTRRLRVVEGRGWGSGGGERSVDDSRSPLRPPDGRLDVGSPSTTTSLCTRRCFMSIRREARVSCGVHVMTPGKSGERCERADEIVRSKDWYTPNFTKV